MALTRWLLDRQRLWLALVARGRPNRSVGMRAGASDRRNSRRGSSEPPNNYDTCAGAPIPPLPPFAGGSFVQSMWALPELAHDECGHPRASVRSRTSAADLAPRPARRPTSSLGTDSAGRDSCSGAAASLCSRRLESPDARKQVYRDSGLKSGGGGNRTLVRKLLPERVYVRIR